MAPPLIPLLADCVWGGPATGISGLDGVAGAPAGVAAGLEPLGAVAVGLDGDEGCWRTLKGEEMPAGAQHWLAVVPLCVPGSRGCHAWLHSGLQAQKGGLPCRGATEACSRRAERRPQNASQSELLAKTPLGGMPLGYTHNSAGNHGRQQGLVIPDAEDHETGASDRAGACMQQHAI